MNMIKMAANQLTALLQNGKNMCLLSACAHLWSLICSLSVFLSFVCSVQSVFLLFYVCQEGIVRDGIGYLVRKTSCDFGSFILKLWFT